MVVACFALSVALGGTSYAAITLPRNSVGTKQLKKNAVTAGKVKTNAITSPKVRNNAMTGADIDEASLGTVPSATNAISATNATTAGNADRLDGLDSSALLKAANAVVRSNTKTSAAFNDEVGVNCNAGEVAVGGGRRLTSGTIDTIFFFESRPIPVSGTPTGWWTSWYNQSGTSKGVAVYVICAS
jgi:hypothetical protein